MEVELMPPASGTAERLELIDKLAEELLVLGQYGPQAVQAATERAVIEFRKVIAKQVGGAWLTHQVDAAAVRMIVSANQKVIEHLRAQVRDLGEVPVA